MDQSGKVVKLKEPHQLEFPSHIDKPDGIHNTLNWSHPCNAFPIIDKSTGKVSCNPKRRKVALVGYAASTRDLAPFNDPEWEIWGLNQLNRMIPRADRWFELHKEWNTSVVEGTDYVEFLRTLPIPVYMSNPHPDIRMAIPYPKDELVKAFGIEYLTSTIAEMLALAIHEGFQEIALYGIDLTVGDEWCLSPEMRVLTKDLRWIPAGKLNVGDSLVAFDEESETEKADGTKNSRRWRCATLLEKQEIIQPCYRLHLSDGTSIVSSDKHRWLTKCGSAYKWVETGKMDTPMHRKSTRMVKLTEVWEDETSWEAGYLAGAFDGEGHFIQTDRNNGLPESYCVKLGFSQRTNAMSRKVDLALSSLGFQASKKQTQNPNLENGSLGKGDCSKIEIQGGRPEIMRFLGQVRPLRLLDKFNPDRLGRIHDLDHPSVVRVEFLGERPVIGLKTSTGTLVVEGMASHNSYQRPCAEFWLGVAHGKGIDIKLPNATALLKSRYSYGYSMGNEIPIATNKIRERLAKCKKEMEDCQIRMDTLNGCAQTLQSFIYAQEIWENGGDTSLF